MANLWQLGELDKLNNADKLFESKYQEILKQYNVANAVRF